MADMQEIVNNILIKAYKGNKKNASEYNPGYEIGAVVGNLAAAYNDMHKVRRNGYDNYAHRLGMCLNGQRGLPAYAGSLLLGGLKEDYDLVKKIGFDRKPVAETWDDSVKDMENNIEALNWGLQNPDGSCIMWLKDFDYSNNKWRNR